MTLGKPVVASRVGGLLDIVAHEHTGLWWSRATSSS